MTLNEIKKLLKFAKAQGIHKIRVGEMEAEFAYSYPPVLGVAPAAPMAEPAVSEIEGEPDLPMSYEELLLRSSPVFDLMQDEKDAAEKLAQ